MEVGLTLELCVCTCAPGTSGVKNGREWGRSVNGTLRKFQGLGKMDSVLDVVNASEHEMKTIHSPIGKPARKSYSLFPAIDKAGKPLLIYGKIELLIGLTAAFLSFLFSPL